MKEQFVAFNHWSRGRLRSKHPKFRKYVKGILALTNVDSLFGARNFKAQKIFELAEILNFEFLMQQVFHVGDFNE